MSNLVKPKFSTATGKDVRVRFCPSPTGTPHVGMVRTALFNWAYARHTGGTFIFRIEDTDQARDSEESYGQILDSMRWLGLDWNEGIDVGGPNEPYRQSQRGDIYSEIAQKLLDAGYLYESFSTAEEIDARNAANNRPKQLGYDNFDRDLTDEQKAAFRAEGREPALRFRVPDADLSFDDLVRGEISFPAGSTIDFVVVRPNGQPLYTLTNPVDDALMGVTHVLRGEDLLSSTPRQIALHMALVELGIEKEIPQFGHLPYVMGEGNKKLSKRDPESNLLHHRERGFIREGLINYLSLLGWSIAADRDIFSVAELVAAFDVKDVNPNPARFDQKKADSVNADQIRLLTEADFVRRIVPYLQAAGVLSVTAESVAAAQVAAADSGVDPLTTLTPRELEILAEAAPLVQTRVTVLSEVPGMVGFLFKEAAEIDYEADALKTLDDGAGATLEAAIEALAPLAAQAGGAVDDAAAGGWNAATMQETLNEALVTGLGLKPRFAFTPLRVAVSGRRVSPPLFESMQILGAAETMARLERLRADLA